MCQDCHDRTLLALQGVAREMISSGHDMDSVLQACFRCGVYVLAGIIREGGGFRDAETDEVMDPVEIIEMHTKTLGDGYRNLQAQHELHSKATVEGVVGQC